MLDVMQHLYVFSDDVAALWCVHILPHKICV